MSALLELQDVHTFYGKIEALKGITLNVNEGEIVTLIGANGAGKSTTLRSISGMTPPKSGAIRFEGKDIGAKPVHDISALRLVHVPEGRRIFPQMTVQENLQMGAFLRPRDPAVAQSLEHVLQLFPRLKERLNQKGGTLSGGEQQMLAMGRAIMAKPKLLMLDEPSMGLAPVIVDLIFDTIKRLNEEGMTILLVEQNAATALQVAHRGYVLEVGSIVLEGGGNELLNDEAVRKTYLGEA